MDEQPRGLAFRDIATDLAPLKDNERSCDPVPQTLVEHVSCGFPKSIPRIFPDVSYCCSSFHHPTLVLNANFALAQAGCLLGGQHTIAVPIEPTRSSKPLTYCSADTY